MKQLTHVPGVLPTPFETVMVRAPVAAVEETLMLAVNEVVDTNVVELTVIPDPENETVEAATKLVPVIVTF